MDRSSLHALLAQAPLLADGGTGTGLLSVGIPVAGCVEGWNLEEPERVEALHRASIDAGARLVISNTFGANRFRLGQHGLGEQVDRLNVAGVEAAKRAGAALVGGSMGPLGVRLAPYGRLQPEDAFDAYRAQASALAAAGADLLVIETQTDLREMEVALAASREAAPALAVLVSASFTRDDRTPLGSTPGGVAARLAELGADVIGVNCGEGPAQMLRLVRAMVPEADGVPVAARPNAGGPSRVAGRVVYPATPAYVAEHAVAAVAAGASIVGGCCGTGPEHTAAIARALARTERPVQVETRSEVPTLPSVDASVEPSALESALRSERFVVAVEMEPPRSTSVATLVAAATTLREAGADVVDVADSPMAKMRMSAWAACRTIQEEAGIETVLHFPTRGRNLLRLQGDLLGAHALGIRNVFVCVGDPVAIGEYPQTLNDVDVTATGLIELITRGFNEGIDRRGSTIGEPTAFFAGAAVAPAAPDLGREVRLLHRKVLAGAAFLLSQPVYDAAPIRALRSAYEREAGHELEVPIIAGLLPILSARHASFLHNEVPGIVVPESVRARIEGAGGDTWGVGREIALELLETLRGEDVAGIYLMPQFGRYDLAADLVEATRA
ncbi:MAG: bifunctional homocysteine S-methyltransferase/methylenetetrahydrofolate reductase [Actinomycetota bacterium]|nr:bifunctional homocysteine S-methyltransferase/methylenetetrahydrofolate reductase [Actinomycetota bacterium]